MRSDVDTARLRCSVPGCTNGLRVPLAHLASLLAAQWRCPGPHDREEVR